jgi:glucan biosynthesis protein
VSCLPPSLFVAFSSCTEETMRKVDNVVPFKAPQNAIKALRRLRKSYRGRLAEKPVTEADQAVLRAVERTLNAMKNAPRVIA